MARTFDFTLGNVEAGIVGRALDVDVRQFPLRIGNITIDPARFVAVARTVHAELEQRRLSVSGELHPSVQLAFELLGEHRVSLSTSGFDQTLGDIATLTVTDGAQALRIAQDTGDGSLHFSLFPDEDLVETTTGALPSVRAATTGEHTIEHRAAPARSAMAERRLAEAEAEDEETEAFGNIELRGTVRAPRRRTTGAVPASDSAEVLAKVLAAERSGYGHIIASGIGRHQERRTATPLTWLDTADGRYLVWTETGTGSAGTSTATETARYQPAGPAELARAVRQAVASVY